MYARAVAVSKKKKKSGEWGGFSSLFHIFGSGWTGE